MNKKDFPMTVVIADRELTVTDGEGNQEGLVVQIRKPAPDPKDGKDWYCPLRTVGFGKNTALPCFGVDALQALQLAMGFIPTIVEVRTKGAVVTFMDSSDLGLEPWSPGEGKNFEN